MGSLHPRPLILDAGALIAFERSDRRVLRLFELAEEIHVPAGVVAQVWRDPVRQVRLVRLLQTDEVEVHPLDLDTAKVVGQICRSAGAADVVDVSVVLVSRAHPGVVLTSDRQDLHSIDPSLDLVDC